MIDVCATSTGRMITKMFVDNRRSFWLLSLLRGAIMVLPVVPRARIATRTSGRREYPPHPLLRFALLSALLLRSSSFVDLPPTFCVSRVLACYASVWGPEYLWTIALYCGYEIRNLLEIRKMPLLALVTISVVIVSSFLATQ